MPAARKKWQQRATKYARCPMIDILIRRFFRWLISSPADFRYFLSLFSLRCRHAAMPLPSRYLPRREMMRNAHAVQSASAAARSRRYARRAHHAAVRCRRV
jgi:hypothetical protein